MHTFRSAQASIREGERMSALPEVVVTVADPYAEEL